MLFRPLFFVLVVAMLAIRFTYALRVRRMERRTIVERQAAEREGLWSVALRGVLFVWLLAALILYALTPPWMGRLELPIPALLRWAGVALGIASLPLLVWVHHALGRYWSTGLQLRANHALVTDGPYRQVRHPMYVVIYVYMIGIALVSAHWLFVLLTAASIVILQARMGKEEAMLLERFGDEYRAYMQRTGRLFPHLRRRGQRFPK